MTGQSEKIYDDVLDLPTAERIELIDKLLLTITPQDDEIIQAWSDEAERRIDELDAGSVKSIPGEEVFSEIHKRLGK